MAVISTFAQGGTGKIAGVVGEALGAINHDVLDIAFQLALDNIIVVSGLESVIIDTIDSASAVTIISGAYSSGKVYI